jgi:hypothetical protein
MTDLPARISKSVPPSSFRPQRKNPDPKNRFLDCPCNDGKGTASEIRVGRADTSATATGANAASADVNISVVILCPAIDGDHPSYTLFAVIPACLNAEQAHKIFIPTCPPPVNNTKKRPLSLSVFYNERSSTFAFKNIFLWKIKKI